MHQDLRHVSQRLKELAVKKPTPQYRSEVAEALRSKHEGIRVCAAKTLGAWGDAASLKSLRSLVETFAKAQAKWGALGAAVVTLEPHIERSDVKWVMRLYLRDANPHSRHTLLRLVEALPSTEALACLEKEETCGGVNPADIRIARHALLTRNAV